MQLSKLSSQIVFSLVAMQVSALAPAFCAGTNSTTIDPPANLKLALTLTGHGHQIYECKKVAVVSGPSGTTGDSSSKFEWVLKGPEADLFDQSNKKVGKHYAGPTWVLNDGDKVVGQVKAKMDVPESDSIPWLLLDVTQASGAQLADVVAIQRVDTEGGKAPFMKPSESFSGDQIRSPYSAIYKFYKKAE